MRRDPLTMPELTMIRQQRTLKSEELPVLNLSLEYPQLSKDTPGLRRISRYYQKVAEQWQQRWEGELYRRACAAAQQAQATSRPFRIWNAVLTCQPVLQTKTKLSFLCDACEQTGSARKYLTRLGDVWELSSGTPQTLVSFFPPHFHWKKEVLEQIAQQIQHRISTGEVWYREDWQSRLPRCFHPERFYCTPEGPTVFFPQNTIAHPAEGIPVFPLVLPGKTQ